MKRLHIHVIVALIRAYQLVLAPLWPGRCRFHPTCSNYTVTAIQSLGMVRGLWMAAKRILRCHPYSAGGYDPVPLDK